MVLAHSWAKSHIIHLSDILTGDLGKGTNGVFTSISWMMLELILPSYYLNFMIENGRF
jgi:hypothetical protein